MDNILFWFLISIVALVADIITSSFFFAGFTIGGIAALIANILGYSAMIQTIVFIIVSAAAITFEFTWLRKRVKKTIPKTLRMEEEYIGKIIIVEEDINKRSTMKIGGIYWTVENEGERIIKGNKVEVVGIRGNKIIIKKIGEEF